jgi:hypothetical protein
MSISLVPRPATARPDHSQPRVTSALSAAAAGVLTALLLMGVLRVVPADAALSVRDIGAGLHYSAVTPVAAPVVLPTIRVVAPR